MEEMSYQNDFLAIRPRKQRCLLPEYSSSSQRVDSITRTSTRTRHLRICSSTSLPPYGSTSQANLDCADFLDPLSDITLDSDLDQRTASSATLLSQSDLPSRLSGSRQSCFLYPLHEPGQMTAQRTQRLRARIASVIMSIPATCEDVDDVDEDEPREAVEVPPAPASKLRRVSGVRDLRRAFREADHGPAHFPSISSLGLSKASYELGILPTQTPLLSNLSPRSSLRTLVDLGSSLHKSTADLKTLCGSTLSSVSIASRFATKIHPTFSPPRPPHTFLPTDTSQPIFPRKYPVHNSSIPRSHRRMSLYQDTRPPRSPGEGVWSCAKISQSTVKLATRRGHPPRRVFSNPIAVLSS